MFRSPSEDFPKYDPSIAFDSETQAGYTLPSSQNSFFAKILFRHSEGQEPDSWIGLSNNVFS